MTYHSTSTDRSRCSNHGNFNSVSGCVCDTGWTGESLRTIIDVNVRSLICSVLNVDSSSFELNSGLSDLAIIDGVDCDTSLTAVVVLSYIVVCTTTLCAVMVIRYLVVRMIDRKSIFIVSRDPRSIFPIFFLLYLIFTLFYGGLKIQYQGLNIIGRDLFMTVVGCSAPCIAFVGAFFYFFVVIKFLRSYIKIAPLDRREGVVRRFALLVRVCEYIPPLSAGSCLMPGVGLAYHQYWHIFARVYHIGIALSAWLYGILTVSALRLVLFELKTHVETFPDTSHDLRVVMRRLTSAYYVIAINSFSVGFLSLTFASFEYLLRRTTYAILINSFSISIAATVLILTVSKIPTTPKVQDVYTVNTFSSMKKRLSSFSASSFNLERLISTSTSAEPPIRSTSTGPQYSIIEVKMLSDSV